MSQHRLAQEFQQKIKEFLITPSAIGVHHDVEQQPEPTSQVSADQLNPTAPSEITTTDKLKLLEEVMDEVESAQKEPVLRENLDKNIDKNAQAVSVDQTQDLTNQSGLNGSAQSTQSAPMPASRKETVEGRGLNLTEQAPSIQFVEGEKSPELSPEVESFIQQVQKEETAPKEIVIADAQDSMASDDQYVSERVVVLPITPEIQKKGKRKSVKFSIRWLVEWSQKIIKMFQGKVVYREEQV